MKKWGFTLIELLIVVAIIAILAAIAVPNFLEAQVRSKVSRAKADMRSLATAIESYYTDNNHYPTGYGIRVAGGPFGVWCLSTPISYITSGKMKDPFSRNPGMAGFDYYIYSVYDIEGREIEAGGGGGDTAPAGTRDHWWMTWSRGPNHTAGYRSTEPEYDIQARVHHATTDWDANKAEFIDTVYDPTNGTVSTGDIERTQLNSEGSTTAK